MSAPTGGTSGETSTGHAPPLVYRLGREELVIRRRYEVLSIVNDILVGLWFLVGSILFFSAETTYVGTWFFVIGSVELLIRPGIRFARRVHLQRVPMAAAVPTDYGPDF
ncbi:YrhK family protein [Actinomycetospora flava]|uniref:YrhK family protein n=1 Tax=Actinomycetospora flava TaxID=3129232 RepID=A0ABU8M1T0_9PSEU